MSDSPLDAGKTIPLAKRPVFLWLCAWACFALATLVVYGRACDFPFLLDDHFHFVANPTVRSWSGLPAVWTTNHFEAMGESGLYRPLLKTIWTAEIVALGGSRGAVLLASAIGHGLNAALVAMLGIFAGLAPVLSFAAGLWFALHAAHSEVLLASVGQGEIFGLSMALAAIALVFPRVREDQGIKLRRGAAGFRLVLFGALMAAGLFVKEQAFMAVAVGSTALVLNPAFSRKAKIAAIVSLALAVAVCVAARIKILGAFGPQGAFIRGEDLSWLERIPLIFYLFGRFVILALAPLRLSPDYSWLNFDLSTRGAAAIFCVGLAASAAFTALLVRFVRRRDKIGLLLWLLALAPLVPFIGIRPIGGSLFGERHAYHALAGAALLIALGGQWIARGQKSGSFSQRGRIRIIAALVCLWSLGLGYRASLQVPAWGSGKTLWRETWRQCPQSFFAAAELAFYQMSEARFQEARKSAQAAIDLLPAYAPAHLTLGELDLIEGAPASARGHFIQAVNHPTFGFAARVGIVKADKDSGNLDQARAGCLQLMQENPADARLKALWREMEEGAAKEF
jgi:tetratricopeptide (TPR) repeat protein